MCVCDNKCVEGKEGWEGVGWLEVEKYPLISVE